MKIHIRLAMSGYYWIEKMIVSDRKQFTLVQFIFKYIYIYIYIMRSYNMSTNELLRIESHQSFT